MDPKRTPKARKATKRQVWLSDEDETLLSELQEALSNEATKPSGADLIRFAIREAHAAHVKREKTTN